MTDKDGDAHSNTAQWLVYSPGQAIQWMIDDIRSKRLPDGTTSALVSVLQAAAGSLDRQNSGAAVQQMSAFTTVVGTQSRSLGATYAAALTRIANELISAINNNLLD